MRIYKKQKDKAEIFYINILIVFLLIVSLAVAYFATRGQLELLFVEAGNTTREIDATIKSGVDSVFFLKTAVDEIYKKISKTGLRYAPKVHRIDNIGNYALNIPELANLTGFDGLKNSYKVQLEMEMSIELTEYFKIVKERNKDYAWVYYISKHKFYTMYPFVHSKEFTWFRDNAAQPLYMHAIPKNNPNGKFFFTPLYFDGVGLGLMVTLGHPIYYNGEFAGTVDLDITLASQSKILKKNNLENGSFLIVNKYNQVIGSDGIQAFNDKKIFLANELISSDISSLEPTQNNLQLIGSNFVFVKNLKNAPWRLYYQKSVFEVFLNSSYLVLPILFIVFMLFRVKALLNTLYLANLDIITTSNNLEEVNLQVTKSIEFSSLIQKTFSYTHETINTFVDDYFVILEQRDIVGGDIVLFEKLNNDACLFFIIDCTGHGVPGAFVTMIVKTLQRQIVKDIIENGASNSPSDILSHFNRDIKDLLNQTSKSSISNVGFDGQVIYYNKKENVLKFASARNDIVIISKGELKRIRGDRHSVGYKDSDENFKFQEHTIEIDDELLIYLYSDGATDQLGGDQRMLPYGTKKLHALISENHNKTMTLQKDRYIEAIYKYRGNNKSNDDISFIGLRIKNES